VGGSEFTTKAATLQGGIQKNLLLAKIYFFVVNDVGGGLSRSEFYEPIHNSKKRITPSTPQHACHRQSRQRPTPRIFAACAGGVMTVETRVSAAAQ
jgi:hypothetical protein